MVGKYSTYVDCFDITHNTLEDQLCAYSKLSEKTSKISNGHQDFKEIFKKTSATFNIYVAATCSFHNPNQFWLTIMKIPEKTTCYLE